MTRFGFVLSILTLAGAGTAVHAQNQPLFPIVSLHVEGNETFPRDKILAVAGLKTGQMAEPKIFDAAQKRLMDTGYFESVGYKYSPAKDQTGYAATFTVVEVQQVFPVRFDRMPKPAAEFKAYLHKADPLFGDKIPGTQPVIKRYSELLEKMLGEKVVGRVNPDDKGELGVVFEPSKRPPSVAEVKFKGNTVLQATPLQNAIAGTAVGAVYEEKRFRQLLDEAIRPLYEARGRVRVAFPSITTEPVMDVNGLRVTVEVNEGEVYTLGNVKVVSPAGGEAELLRQGNLKKEDIANFDEIKASVERMRAAVRRNGYMKAATRVERQYDDAKKIVHLTVHIEPGDRYTFRSLDVKGLDLLTEPAIRKMWGLKPGDPFNPEFPGFFLNRVRDEGIFDNLGKTKTEVKIDENTRQADVILYFSGAEPPPKKRELP